MALKRNIVIEKDFIKIETKKITKTKNKKNIFYLECPFCNFYYKGRQALSNHINKKHKSKFF